MPISARERLAALELPGTVRRGALPAEPVRRLPVGIAALDELLGGGLPRGHLSELVGGPSSGRTAVLHALLAGATRAGEVVAVVDLPDALDPTTLARAGADLARVLWVRPPTLPTALKCAELILTAGGFGVVALDLDTLGARTARPPAHAAWPRLAQVARRADAVAVISAPRRLTGGAAVLALALTQHRARWSERVFEGLTTSALLTRSRFSPSERAVVLTLGEQLAALDGVRVQRFPAERRRREGRAGERAASG